MCVCVCVCTSDSACLCYACAQIHLESPIPGDVLVFLAGQDDIESLKALIEDRLKRMKDRLVQVRRKRRSKGLTDRQTLLALFIKEGCVLASAEWTARKPGAL